MRSINRVHHLRRRPAQLAQKIYFPKPVNVLGHDPLLTPRRLPHGERAEPFREIPFVFEAGAKLDIVQ